jgi:SAM-dependent methyltransferase
MSEYVAARGDKPVAAEQRDGLDDDGGRALKGLPDMADTRELDYVLGTNDQEIVRLGVQHRVWRSRVLECWREAGITAGSRVLDVGAGPGYATADLAEIVGPSGQVIGVERSGRFIEAARQRCRTRGLVNVSFRECDLMTGEIDAPNMDASWCRWVAAFVNDPGRLVAILAKAIRTGGAAIFHEYIDYRSFRLAPRRPAFEYFVEQVIEAWRESGGEPDIAAELPGLLSRGGFKVQGLTPIPLLARPNDYNWQWPASFVDSGVDRLVELGRIDARRAEEIRGEFLAAQADPNTVLITPMVLEIVAARV